MKGQEDNTIVTRVNKNWQTRDGCLYKTAKNDKVKHIHTTRDSAISSLPGTGHTLLETLKVDLSMWMTFPQISSSLQKNSYKLVETY